MSFHRVFDPVPDPTRGTAPAQLGWRRNSATKALKGRSWPGPVRRREAFGSRPFASEVETRQPSQPSAPDGDKGDWYTDWQVNTKNNFKTKTHTHTQLAATYLQLIAVIAPTILVLAPLVPALTTSVSTPTWTAGVHGGDAAAVEALCLGSGGVNGQNWRSQRGSPEKRDKRTPANMIVLQAFLTP